MVVTSGVSGPRVHSSVFLHMKGSEPGLLCSLILGCGFPQGSPPLCGLDPCPGWSVAEPREAGVWPLTHS